jgi:hypothetical protein
MGECTRPFLDQIPSYNLVRGVNRTAVHIFLDECKKINTFIVI